MSAAVGVVISGQMFDAEMLIINAENVHTSTKFLVADTLKEIIETKDLSEVLNDQENIAQTMKVGMTSSHMT